MYNSTFYYPRNYIPNIPTRVRRNMIPINQVARIGLFEKIGNTIKGIKSLNWGGFINNTSKTLGIINQTIPLVKQVGPIVGNMRSMIKIASIFKDETELTTQSTKRHNKDKNISNTNPINKQDNNTNNNEDYSPNFFIN